MPVQDAEAGKPMTDKQSASDCSVLCFLAFRPLNKTRRGGTRHARHATLIAPSYAKPSMLQISSHLIIPETEIELQSIRAQGSGGQKVNKTSSAVHLRFDIKASSLPDFYKQRLLGLRDSRITKDGIIIIKAQQYRTLEQNRQNALDRLGELIKSATVIAATRRPTKPTRGSQKRRMDSKTKHSKLKQLRKKTDF